ncbi:MAG: cell division protein FtsQ/DivIB, partial [Gemmatimonadales bacterium]
LKPGWLLVAVMVLLPALWFSAPRLLRRLDFFRLRRVEILGLENGSTEAVLDVLRIPPGASLFDDLEPIRRRAGTLPGVSHLEVSRRLPGTLRIEVSEMAPVGLVPAGDALRLMDARGRILPFDPTLAAPDLPVVPVADSAVAGVLGHARDADPGLFARVSSAWRAQDDVILEAGGRRLWFRPDAPVEVIRAVEAVAQDLARKGRLYQELDGRFAGQVVVRGPARRVLPAAKPPARRGRA